MAFFLRILDNVLQLEDGHKEAVLSAHFAACDWMRELVNAFVLEPDSDTKAKVIRGTDGNPGSGFCLFFVCVFVVVRVLFYPVRLGVFLC